MTADRLERFRLDYQLAFLRHLSQRDEATRTAAYELGRSAIVETLSLLDVSQVHHSAFLQALRDRHQPDELEDCGEAASEFFLEVLASFEMTQRGYAEARREEDDGRSRVV